MKMLLIGIIVVLALGASIGGYALMNHMYGNYGLSPYSQSYNGNGYPTTYGTLIPVQQAITLMKSPPSYVHVFTNNNSIVFTSQEINLVVLTMGHKRAENLTGRPSPTDGNVFVIYGLINPTLIIPQGATIHVTVINLDAGDYHNFVITTEAPPYSYNLMMGGGMMQGGMMNGGRFITMMPLLPPANYQTGYAHEFQYTFTLHQGEFWYICTYPGHAEGGMYGEIIVA